MQNGQAYLFSEHPCNKDLNNTGKHIINIPFSKSVGVKFWSDWYDLLIDAYIQTMIATLLFCYFLVLLFGEINFKFDKGAVTCKSFFDQIRSCPKGVDECLQEYNLERCHVKIGKLANL